MVHRGHRSPSDRLDMGWTKTHVKASFQRHAAGHGRLLRDAGVAAAHATTKISTTYSSARHPLALREKRPRMSTAHRPRPQGTHWINAPADDWFPSSCPDWAPAGSLIATQLVAVSHFREGACALGSSGLSVSRRCHSVERNALATLGPHRAKRPPNEGRGIDGSSTPRCLGLGPRWLRSLRIFGTAARWLAVGQPFGKMKTFVSEFR